MAAKTDAVIQHDLQSTGTVPGVPVAFDPTNNGVVASLLISDTAARDPANTLTIVVKASYLVNGENMVIESQGTWAGNPADDPRNPGEPMLPAVGVSFVTDKPYFVTVDLLIPAGVAFSVGAQIAQNP